MATFSLSDNGTTSYKESTQDSYKLMCLLLSITGFSEASHLNYSKAFYYGTWPCILDLDLATKLNDLFLLIWTPSDDASPDSNSGHYDAASFNPGTT